MKKMTSEEKLKKAGWTKQFTACEPRLSEAVELYKELDFEVRLEPVIPEELDESEKCKICYEADGNKYKTIYTRARK